MAQSFDKYFSFRKGALSFRVPESQKNPGS